MPTLLWLAWFTGWWNDQAPISSGQENHWFDQGIEIGARESLGSNYFVGLQSGHDRFDDFRKVDITLTRHLILIKERPVGAVERAKLLRLRSLIPFYERSAVELSQIFLQVGYSGDIGIGPIKQYGEYLTKASPPCYFPFSDVLLNHWASPAIGDLRALGLIQGYPGGHFHG